MHVFGIFNRRSALFVINHLNFGVLKIFAHCVLNVGLALLFGVAVFKNKGL